MGRGATPCTCTLRVKCMPIANGVIDEVIISWRVLIYFHCSIPRSGEIHTPLPHSRQRCVHHFHPIYPINCWPRGCRALHPAAHPPPRAWLHQRSTAALPRSRHSTAVLCIRGARGWGYVNPFPCDGEHNYHSEEMSTQLIDSGMPRKEDRISSSWG